MATLQTEVESQVVKLSTEAIRAFCLDISGMFGIEIEHVKDAVATESVGELKQRFGELAAVNSVKAEGDLDGTFQIVFDKTGLFIMAGVITMPEQMTSLLEKSVGPQKVMQNIDRGSVKEAQEASNAIGEAGNLMIGSWNRIFREEMEGDGHFTQTDTFVGNPWDKPEDKIGIASDAECILVSFKLTIGNYPPFICGVVFPKPMFAEADAKMEEKVKAKKEADAKAKKEAEAKAKKEAEAKAKKEAEVKAKKEAEAKAKKEAEAKAKKEAEEKAKAEAEAKAKAEAEAKAKKEAETKAKAEAEAKAKVEAEEKAKAEAEAKAKAEAKEEHRGESETETTEEAKARVKESVEENAEVEAEGKTEAKEEVADQAEDKVEGRAGAKVEADKEVEATEEIETRAEEKTETEAEAKVEAEIKEATNAEPEEKAEVEGETEQRTEVKDESEKEAVEMRTAESAKVDEERPVSKAIKELTSADVFKEDPVQVPLKMPASEIMQKEVVWGAADDNVQQVLTKMQQYDAGYMLVGEEGVLEGIVSKSDLTGAISPYLRPIFSKWRRSSDDATLQIRVKWIMSRPVHTVGLSTPLSTVMDNMCQSGQRALPVVDEGGRVEGLITVFDIFRVLLAEDASISVMGKTPQAPPLL